MRLHRVCFLGRIRSASHCFEFCENWHKALHLALNAAHEALLFAGFDPWCRPSDEIGFGASGKCSACAFQKRPRRLELGGISRVARRV